MPKQLLRILCYGDSLTAGYSAFGTIYHPYSEVLEQKLVAAFPDLKVDISESGMPGDLAINGAFLTRLNSERTSDFPISSGVLNVRLCKYSR